jgi:hypothetical protein
VAEDDPVDVDDVVGRVDAEEVVAAVETTVAPDAAFCEVSSANAGRVANVVAAALINRNTA